MKKQEDLPPLKFTLSESIAEKARRVDAEREKKGYEDAKRIASQGFPAIRLNFPNKAYERGFKRALDEMGYAKKEAAK